MSDALSSALYNSHCVFNAEDHWVKFKLQVVPIWQLLLYIKAKTTRIILTYASVLGFNSLVLEENIIACFFICSCTKFYIMQKKYIWILILTYVNVPRSMHNALL